MAGTSTQSLGKVNTLNCLQMSAQIKLVLLEQFKSLLAQSKYDLTLAQDDITQAFLAVISQTDQISFKTDQISCQPDLISFKTDQISCQPDEIILHLMTFLDFKNIRVLALCSKRFSVLALDEYLWARKLLWDQQTFTVENLTSYECYKQNRATQIHAKQISDTVWILLQKCPYILYEEMKTPFQEAILRSFPTISIESVWEHLKGVNKYDFPDSFKFFLEEAIDSAQKSVQC
jgi:hypothetical protein